MEPTPEVIEGLSTFLAPFDDAFFSGLAREYALSLLSLAAEMSPTARLALPSVTSFVNSRLVESHEPFWFPELGHWLMALKGDDQFLAHTATAQLILNLCGVGMEGEWRLDLDRSYRARWGATLLPAATHLLIQADSGATRLAGRNGDETHAWTFDSRDQADRMIGDPLPRIEFGQFKGALLSASRCRELHLPDPVLPGVDAIVDSHIDHVASALQMFHEVFPTFSGWFDRSVQFISLAQQPPDGIHSGSVDGYFGLISMSDSEDPCAIAETLIHEASHQYFYLLNRFVPMANQTGVLYYSPFVQRQRPSERVLMAYHAFANVELFYRACLDKGCDPPRCQQALAQLDRELTSVEPALETPRELTPVGRLLFTTLQRHRTSHVAQVHSAGR